MDEDGQVVVAEERRAREEPPSTASTWPVIQLARSDSRNITAYAMSSGVPRRPQRQRGALGGRVLGGAPAGLLGVRTVPGATVFTRMPALPSSSAAVRMSASIPAFAAAYDAPNGIALQPGQRRDVHDAAAGSLLEQLRARRCAS